MDVKIRNWTFTHWWVRPTVKVWFDFYHKNVTYSGYESIDWQQPIIFAPSHQNAFTDALCLILPTSYSNDRFIYPLIRADAFGENALLDWMLTTFHMMPVYRPRDDVNIKEQNESVFAHCHEILFQNRNLLIHPEGNCIPRKKVERFKKGLARIALGAEARKDFGLGVQIVPVGINYRQITEAREGIHVRFGDPIAASAYRDEYKRSKASAIGSLTDKVEDAVRDLTVDITTEDYELTSEIIDLLKSNNRDIDTSSAYNSEEFRFEKKVIENIDKSEQENPDVTKELSSIFEKFQKNASKHLLSTKHTVRETKSGSRSAIEAIGYLLILPVVLYGGLQNLLPYFVMKATANKIQDTQFKNSARMVTGLLVFPVFYIIQTILFGVIWGMATALIYLISLPVSGVIALKATEHFRPWIQQVRIKLMEASKHHLLLRTVDEIAAKIGLTDQQDRSPHSAQS